MHNLLKPMESTQKIALVTGANTGIGFELCKQLAKGYTVILTARNKEKGLESTKILESQGLKVVFKQLDVTEEKDIAQVAQEIEQEFGKLDLLINNAATLPKFLVEDVSELPKFNKIEEFDGARILQLIQVNSISAMIVLKHSLKLLQKGINSKVIEMSSISGSISLTTSGGAYAYTMSKTLLNIFTKISAADLLPFGIVTVALHPGFVQTRLGRKDADETPEKAVESMLKVIENLQLQDSGKFLNNKGEELPW